MENIASDLSLSERYYPIPFEEKILKYYLKKYFGFPERSTERNKIAKFTSQVLLPYSKHWTHRNVRIWFLNHKFLQFSEESNEDIPNNSHNIQPSINLQLTPNISVSYTDTLNKQSKNESNSQIQNYSFDLLYDQDNLKSTNDKMNEKRLLQKEIHEKVNKKCELMREKKKLQLETFSENQIQSNLNENQIITVPTQKENMSNIIFSDLNKNKNRFPNGRRFTDEMIDYCFLIKYGPNSYDDFRYFLPAPCTKTLKNRREEDIEKLKIEIVNDGNMNEVICMRLKDKIQESEKVNAILSIDAIEIALFQRVNELIKNLFIFYLILLNSQEKPFPIKALSHENGKVGKDLLQIINEKIAKTFFNNPFIDLQYIAVDGDSGYNGEFENEFQILFDHFIKFGFEKLSEKIDQLKGEMKLQGKWLKITDMIHFLKNRRTQLIITSVEINEIEVFVECLQNVLYQSASIMDKSALSKLQDTFPIEIFNFQVFLGILECGNFDLIFYIFPIICWNEAANNSLIGKNMRLFLLECALYGFGKFYEIQLSTGNKMEIMPNIAIKRAFSTIAIIWHEFKNSEGIFKFAEFSTMLQEHYHGMLRGMTKGVDTLDNVINCIVKSNIVMDIQSRNGLSFRKKTRFSVGGIHFDPKKHVLDIQFEYKPIEIIERLFQLSSYCQGQNENDTFLLQFKSFLEIISKGSLRIKCTNKHFHYGRSIITREITNYKESLLTTTIDEQNDIIEDEAEKVHLINEINQINWLLNEEEETNDDSDDEYRG